MALSKVRSCPTCGREISYKSANVRDLAEKRGTSCKKCVQGVQLSAFTRAALERPWVRLRPFESLFNARKRSSTLRGVAWLLTYEELVEFIKIEACHYCDGKIQWNTFRHSNLNLDRKDNHQAYTKINLVVCCGMCNHIKGSVLSYEDMLLLRPALRKLQKKLAIEGRTWHGQGGRPCAE